MKSPKFTSRMQEAIKAAERAARALNHACIGTEHLLLGLMEQDSGVVVETLQVFGVDAEKVRAEIEKLVHPGPTSLGTQELPFTRRALRAISLAQRAAALWNQGHIDTEYLFLGLISEHEGVAALALRNLGISTEKVGPEIFRERLSLMKSVERIVRPVQAGLPRKRKMREELMAHLTEIYEEEKAAGKNPSAALTDAAQRLGNGAKLASELQASLPWSERFAFAIERHFGWRAPESAARYCLRLGINFAICMTCCIALPLFIESLLIDQFNSAQWWMVVRLCGLFLFWLPSDIAVLTWIYLKMRDAIWGVFGSRKSLLRVTVLATAMAAFTFVFVLLFLAIEAWNPEAAQFWAWRTALAAMSVSIFYLVIASTRGNQEITDTIWASMKTE